MDMAKSVKKSGRKGSGVYTKKTKSVKVRKVRESGDESYRLIDAFSGAGGLTLGFSDTFGHPFESVWANDINRYAVRTYNENFGKHCICGDVSSALENCKIPKADVVIGGPPCQGFSLLNRNREGDPRKQLWRPFMKMVEKSGAGVFVMENVPQLLGSEEQDEIMEVAKEAGFKVWYAKLCAADYGVPQTRHRAFIVGCDYADPGSFFPPKKTNYNPSNGKLDKGEYVNNPQPWKTVRDAISDLPAPKGIEIRKVLPPLDLHFGRSPTELSKRRYEAIPEEGMDRIDLEARAPELTPECWKRKDSGGTDLFGRLWWDKPAFTISP
jgi:DNA (cytosine-5)-methyltransferase 1